MEHSRLLGNECVRASDVAEMLGAESRESIDEIRASMRNEVHFVNEAKWGVGSEEDQRERCSRGEIGSIKIGLEDETVELNELQITPRSFWLNDLSIEHGCGATRAKRSIDASKAIPKYLFNAPLKRCIVSSFLSPKAIDCYFRKHFLAWDTERTIPIVVIGHQLEGLQVVENDEHHRRISNLSNKPFDRFVADAESMDMHSTTIILPKLSNEMQKDKDTYKGCAHAKMIQAEYDDAGVRICISSANMHSKHFLHMLETWYIQDFVKKAKIIETPSSFCCDWLKFLGHSCEGLEDQFCVDGSTLAEWLLPLLYCDNRSHAQLVMSMPGTTFCDEKDVIGLKSNCLGYMEKFLDKESTKYALDFAHIPIGRKAAFERDAELNYHDDRIEVCFALDNSDSEKLRVNLPMNLSSDLLLCQDILKAEAISLWSVYSEKYGCNYIMVKLQLSWRCSIYNAETTSDLPEYARAPFIRLITELKTPLGYQSLRTKLHGIDWYKSYAQGDELFFFAYSPSTVEQGAGALAEKIAWASHVDPDIIEGKYKYNDRHRKGWNYRRLPALLSHDEHLVQKTREEFELYQGVPPDGDFYGRLRRKDKSESQNRPYVGAHAKWIYRSFIDRKSGQTYGWCYIGSHNLSNAAWGSGSRWGQIHMSNWELGVLLIEPPPGDTSSIHPSGAGSAPKFHRRLPLPFIPGMPLRDVKTRITSRELKQKEKENYDLLNRFQGDLKPEEAEEIAVAISMKDSEENFESSMYHAVPNSLAHHSANSTMQFPARPLPPNEGSSSQPILIDSDDDDQLKRAADVISVKQDQHNKRARSSLGPDSGMNQYYQLNTGTVPDMDNEEEYLQLQRALLESRQHL